MSWAIRFLGVGAASAPELGSASAMLERDGAPLLMIDCGSEALSAALLHYGSAPPALFVTHTHLDHVSGMERLFGALYFDPQRRGGMPLYVPAAIVPLLQQRVADYPDVLAEGGVNFWDAFRLIPVSRSFWHAGQRFEVFASRHHAPNTAFGLALPGCFVFTGDTRPIPEVLAHTGDGTEPVFHDCSLVGNPSHSGVDDLQREYLPSLQQRMTLYHYGSQDDAAALEQRGFKVARQGDRIALPSPPEST